MSEKQSDQEAFDAAVADLEEEIAIKKGDLIEFGWAVWLAAHGMDVETVDKDAVADDRVQYSKWFIENMTVPG
jgi:hypothetical protein